MRLVRILILEDDLETISLLTQSLVALQKRFTELDLAVTIMAEYTQVEQYLNAANEDIFDIILLDRDCKACGSFHCLDFDKYSVEKIIGISSVPPYNQELRARGVSRIVDKDYQQLDIFIRKLQPYLEELLFNVKFT